MVAPLSPDGQRHPQVGDQRGQGEDLEGVPVGPEGDKAADLVDDAAAPEGQERQAPQRVEGVAEEQEPDGGQGLRSIQPDQ